MAETPTTTARRSRAYALLAVEAGRLAGIAGVPTRAQAAKLCKDNPRKLPDAIDAAAEAVAEDAAARELRDGLWLDYESRLRDAQTYQLADVVKWLADQGAPGSKSAVQRDRAYLQAGARRLQQRVELARETVKLAQDGEGDFLKAARMLTAQHLFRAMEDFDSAALANLKPRDMLNLLQTVGTFSRDDAQAELTQARLRELQEKFDQAMKAVKAKAAGGGGLTDGDIDAARTLVFGKLASNNEVDH